ncbi:MAG: sialate O-acetylesterase [Myxococcota bacterium]
MNLVSLWNSQENSKRSACFWPMLACAVALSCSSNSADNDGTGGNTQSSGGKSTASGGSDAKGGATSGGASASGGSVSNGGSVAQGGVSQGGIGSGGATAQGGASGNGGSTGAGGTNASGGKSSSGGTANGGSSNGGSASGGKMSSGGTASGGTTASGGATSGGKSSTGGATSGGAVGNGGSGGTVSKFHVFLLLGQSNMAGYPKAQAADQVEDARIRVLGFDNCTATGRQTDKWDTAAPPLHECWNGAIGPGDWFAKTLLASIPSGDSIGLVPCAISGEKIETFMKVGGNKYSWIVQRAKLAQQAGGVIEGILFHQGESNCGDSAWPGKVNTLITDLRADLGLGMVPFLAGELAHSGNCANHNPLVNKLPSVVSNAYVVSASGLAVDAADTQWNVHFDHDAQVTFGKRYAQKMIEALHW